MKRERLVTAGAIVVISIVTAWIVYVARKPDRSAEGSGNVAGALMQTAVVTVHQEDVSVEIDADSANELQSQSEKPEPRLPTKQQARLMYSELCLLLELSDPDYTTFEQFLNRRNNLLHSEEIEDVFLGLQACILSNVYLQYIMLSKGKTDAQWSNAVQMSCAWSPREVVAHILARERVDPRLSAFNLADYGDDEALFIGLSETLKGRRVAEILDWNLYEDGQMIEEMWLPKSISGKDPFLEAGKDLRYFFAELHGAALKRDEMFVLNAICSESSERITYDSLKRSVEKYFEGRDLKGSVLNTDVNIDGVVMECANDIKIHKEGALTRAKFLMMVYLPSGEFGMEDFKKLGLFSE